MGFHSAVPLLFYWCEDKPKTPTSPDFGVPAEVNAVVDAVESDGEPALRLRIV